MAGFTHKTKEEVQELTASEMKLVPQLVEIFFKHQGIGNRISRREIDSLMVVKGVGPERVTDMIRHIRRKNLVPCLVSFRRGYYVADTRSDIRDYIRRLDYTINDLTRQIEELCNIKEQLRKDMKNRWGE